VSASGGLGFVGCIAPLIIRSPVKIDRDQIEVARDAWQEDNGASERWRAMLEEHPRAIQNYIGKRFETEAATGFNQAYRITSLSYLERGGGRYEVVDNTPGLPHRKLRSDVEPGALRDDGPPADLDDGR
jgi:hypothetical protein